MALIAYVINNIKQIVIAVIVLLFMAYKILI